MKTIFSVTVIISVLYCSVLVFKFLLHKLESVLLRIFSCATKWVVAETFQRFCELVQYYCCKLNVQRFYGFCSDSECWNVCKLNEILLYAGCVVLLWLF